MMKFLKKIFGKLNTDKTIEEKNKKDDLFFQKTFIGPKEAAKVLEILSKCGKKATDIKRNV